MPRAKLLRTLAIIAFITCFTVVVLGAYVRLSAAGLSCPDWPGCYGHFSPAGATASDTGIEVGKAWKEMVHRYLAATLGTLLIVIAALALQKRTPRVVSPGYAWGLVALVVTQGIFGMLTVTRQLDPAIVTTHLLFGLTTMSLLWWLVLSTRRRRAGVWGGGTSFAGGGDPAQARALATVALVMLAVQIALGGWTSSHYAATGCPDFPTCQGQWWPGLEGNPGIHFLHRLGALATTLVMAWAAVRVLRSRTGGFAHRSAQAVLATLGLQLVIGVTMVIKGFPLWLATAHNAGAALLLLAVIALNRALRPDGTAA
jgi:cytochrome c oxidase assembly protein subunit 15